MNIRWLMVAVWMLLIFGLSNIPSLKFGFGPLWEQVARKSVHVLVYGILTALLWTAVSDKDRANFRRLPVCVIVAALFAVTDEFHQTFIVGRHGNLIGVLFDLLGILLAAGWISTGKARS